jgi:DNA-binding CsgD family transcriptional regulator
VQILDEALGAAVAGFGQTVMISAGAGTGKTALLDEVIRDAAHRGFSVFRAGGVPTEEAFPFALARRLIPVNVGTEGLPDGRALVAPADEIRALNRALEAVGDDRPVLVAVDDCQWSDAASVRWLASLPQLISSKQALFAVVITEGTYGDLAPLDDLRAGADIELHPGCLDRPAISAVLTDVSTQAPSSALVDACAQLTGGNPMLLIGVARALAERIADDDNLDGLRVPALGARLHSRLRYYSPHGLGIAESLAVLGASGTPARVAATADLDRAIVDAELAALHRSGLVESSGGRVQCAFPIVASVLLDKMDEPRHDRLLARAARAVAMTGGPPRAIAELLAGNRDLAGEPWARDALLKAAEAAAEQGSPEAAVRYYRSALDHQEGESAHGSQIDLGAVLARVNVRAALEQLVGVAEGASMRERQRIARLLAGLDGYLDSGGRASASARQVIKAVPPSAERTPGSIADGKVSEDLVKLLGQSWIDSLPGSATNVVTATAQCWSGESPADAMHAATTVLRQAPGAPGDLLAAIQAATVLSECGELERALSYAEDLTNAARRWQDRPAEAMALSLRSMLRREAGLLGPALQDAAASVALLNKCRADPASANATLARARYVQLLVDHGSLEQALSVIRSYSQDSAGTMAGLQMGLARARLLSVAGHPHDALGRLLACGESASQYEIKNPAALLWQPEAAVLFKMSGAANRARDLADDAVVAARRVGHKGALSRALRAQGIVRAGTEGERLIEEATQVVADTPFVLERALALADYGSMLVETGDRSRAKAVLRIAAPLAYECGLPPLVQRVVDAYSAAGGRLHGGHFPGVTLTDAELRVAQLAAAGHTNREIAQSLFVGLRTVEIHLSSAYRKLRVSGRAGLAKALDRKGNPMGGSDGRADDVAVAGS